MRVLVLADIHANWHALSAIDERFDLCLFLGDLVDYGPDPKPCLDWVRQHCDHVVRGNHDHIVAQRVATSSGAGYRGLAVATRPRMWERLDEEDRRYLARMPITQYLRVDGKVIHMVHATPRDPLDEYLFPTDEAGWQRRLERIEADIVCVGHTHQQFQLQIGSRILLNPGSVGQPRDGDPRAAYAIIEDGKIELRRVEYPVEETIRQYEDQTMTAAMKAFAAQVLRDGGKKSVANGPG